MNKIINILKEHKSIPLDRFINIALYDKKFGYYMKKNPFGKKGDFITAPLISKLFSEMIAVWCIAFWEHLGKPNKIFLGFPIYSQNATHHIAIISPKRFEIKGAVIKSPSFPKGFFFI